MRYTCMQYVNATHSCMQDASYMYLHTCMHVQYYTLGMGNIEISPSIIYCLTNDHDYHDLCQCIYLYYNPQ